MPPILVLGCGYVGKRVARALAARGLEVLGTTRDPAALDSIRAAGATPLVVDADVRLGLDQLRVRAGAAARIVLAVPPGGTGSRAAVLLGALDAPPSRVVYLSSTSVYGAATRVDEGTAPCAGDGAGASRLAEEAVVAAGPWSWLTLRAAAVYGPGRGLLAEPPRFERGLDAVRSRIHVEDLTALACAALDADVEGAFPVADDLPASPREMLACAGLEAPRAASEAGTSPGRVVDGRAIRRALRVSLRFPSFRDALPGARFA